MVELLAVTPEPERLIEAAGRTCYLSFDRTGEDTAARFCRMLLNGGQLDGVRILKEATVEMMTSDQVGPLRKGEGFGLGVSVVRSADEAGGLDCVGAFGWGGFWYTTFFVDPAKDLIAISMAQIHPDGQATLNKKFKTLVYEALTK